MSAAVKYAIDSSVLIKTQLVEALSTEANALLALLASSIHQT